MTEELKVLFQELVNLSPAQREALYAQRQVTAAARAELQSLLVFDETREDSLDDSLSGVVGSAATSRARPFTRSVNRSVIRNPPPFGHPP